MAKEKKDLQARHQWNNEVDQKRMKEEVNSPCEEMGSIFANLLMLIFSSHGTEEDLFLSQLDWYK